MSEGGTGGGADDGPPSVPATLEERSQGRRVIVILKRVRDWEKDRDEWVLYCRAWSLARYNCVSGEKKHIMTFGVFAAANSSSSGNTPLHPSCVEHAEVEIPNTHIIHLARFIVDGCLTAQ